MELFNSLQIIYLITTFVSIWHLNVCTNKLTLLVDTSRLNPFFFCIHLAVLLVIIAALLNMCETWTSKSLGTEIPRDFATSDNVWIQFSTLVLCSKVSHWHWATLKAALSNWTKIGCRLWKIKQKWTKIIINNLKIKHV